MRSIIAWLTISALVLPVHANAADNAQSFWKTFRQAVLNGKTSEIVSMTRFPFEVRGVDDGDPVKRYNRHKFPAIFNQVVSQHVIVMTGKDVIEKTMLQIVKEKKDLNAADIAAPDFFRVELFTFHMIKGRWFFTRAYLEESE
jgi:hydroxyethylthiazole kinase-like sugar kinase family protein